MVLFVKLVWYSVKLCVQNVCVYFNPVIHHFLYRWHTFGWIGHIWCICCSSLLQPLSVICWILNEFLPLLWNQFELSNLYVFCPITTTFSQCLDFLNTKGFLLSPRGVFLLSGIHLPEGLLGAVHPPSHLLLPGITVQMSVWNSQC